MFPLKDSIRTERFPLVTLVLIAANVAMYFLFEQGGILEGPQDKSVYDYGAWPWEITHPGEQCGVVGGEPRCPSEQPGLPSTWVTLFTSMFMHGSILHLAGNMLFLWIFGNNVEDAMGAVKYLGCYILGGLAALLLQVVTDPGAQVPTIGASGAVAAVLGGYISLFPRGRVLTLIFIVFFITVIELPAVVMLGLWFIQQLAFGFYGLNDPVGGGGGVAYFAHIGGFVFGLLTVKLLADSERVEAAKHPQPPVTA